MTTKEALELAISELDMVAQAPTNGSDYEELREDLQKLTELLENM